MGTVVETHSVSNRGTQVPPCIALSSGALSTRPGRDYISKSSCLTGSICFQLLCICMALAGRPPQPCCTCGGFRCICIDIAVVEDSLAELDLYPPPCLFGTLGICNAVSTFSTVCRDRLVFRRKDFIMLQFNGPLDCH